MVEQSKKPPVGSPPSQLLIQQHRELLSTESKGRLVSRILGVLAFFYSVIAFDLSRPAQLALAGGVTLLGLLSYLGNGLLEKRRIRLEDLIVQELDRLHPGEWWKKVYAEWQHETWKSPLSHTLVRVEPLLWATATIIVLAFRYSEW
jgi:hypothetical protein